MIPQSSRRLLLAHPGIGDETAVLRYPPWGAIDIATACRATGAEVLVVDLNGREIANSLPGLLVEFKPDIIGLTAKLGNGARRLRRCLDILQNHGQQNVAVGGPLVGSFPDPVDPLWAGVTALFAGDGESAFCDWLAAGAPPTSGVIRGRPTDLGAVAMSSWWENLRAYVQPASDSPGLECPTLHVTAARGCSRRCTFCYLNSQLPDRSLRVLAPELLMQRLHALRSSTGAEGFYFVDDCLLAPGKPDTERLLSLLIEQGAQYRLGCDIQLHELADATLRRRLWQAGFRSFYVGVESSSNRIRRLLGKGPARASTASILRETLEDGFDVMASVGVGWPTETSAEMEDTLHLVESIPRLRLDAFRYTPLPSVPLTTVWARTAGVDGSEENGIDPYADYSEHAGGWTLDTTGSLSHTTKIYDRLSMVAAARGQHY